MRSPFPDAEEEAADAIQVGPYITLKASFFHVVSNVVVVFYFSHDCFVFPLKLLLLNFIQVLPKSLYLGRCNHSHQFDWRYRQTG